MNLADQIRLQPTAADVKRLNAWLDQKFVESGIEASLAADLKLCLNEAMANLISYGFRDTVEPMTVVEIKLQRGLANATVTDNGTYFDIRRWELPKDRDLMIGEPGGFGIALIKERASHVDYSRYGGLNRLKIVCAANP
ncbi:ATP-binding protein [Hyphomicrobium sp. 99]|uniref:ATP-binding protein n=1 Tax=Hyphomicrobium sp. 99 TaxID=1163419 RepID=UPI0005F79626|nr:ATP-binding protein [Hyphomicrobium sp. 99]